MPLLTVKQLNKSYTLTGGEKTSVLRNVTGSFESGEMVAILGESGSGKSTLMNIIGGMDGDYEGDVMVQGKSLRSMKTEEVDNYRRDKIGFIFQSFNLIAHLTVLENVTIAMQMVDKSEKERNQRAIEILKQVGLKDHLKKRPNQLSGGQKQRVAIARALANDPDIILADEPTGALDQETSKQILALLDSIASKGVLIITVTHSQKVADFGSRIILVEDGHIKEDRSLKERYSTIKETEQKKAKSLSLTAAFKLALRNMQLKATRNILVALGGSIGIFSVLLMLSLGNGVTTFMNDEIKTAMNPLLIDIVKPAEDIRSQGQPGQAGRPELQMAVESFTEDDVALISQIENTERLEKVTAISGSINLLFDGKNHDIPAIGSVTSAIQPDDLEKGLLPVDDEVLVTTAFAQQLSSPETYETVVGQTLRLFVNEMSSTNKPVLIEKELLISGIYKQEDMGPLSGPGVYLSYEALEGIYEEQGLQLQPTQINVYAKDLNDVKAIKESVEEAGFESSPISNMLDQVMTYVDMATWLLAGIAGISLLVSGIMILVVLYIGVVERTREIGILRAIGARQKDIKRIFFSESALLGLMSGTIAVISVWIVSMGLNGLLENIFGAKLIVLTPGYMLFGIGISTLISVIAGLLPSSKAAKLDPMESLRYE